METRALAGKYSVDAPRRSTVQQANSWCPDPRDVLRALTRLTARLSVQLAQQLGLQHTRYTSVCRALWRQVLHSWCESTPATVWGIMPTACSVQIPRVGLAWARNRWWPLQDALTATMLLPRGAGRVPGFQPGPFTCLATCVAAAWVMSLPVPGTLIANWVSTGMLSVDMPGTPLDAMPGLERALQPLCRQPRTARARAKSVAVDLGARLGHAALLIAAIADVPVQIPQPASAAVLLTQLWKLPSAWASATRQVAAACSAAVHWGSRYIPLDVKLQRARGQFERAADQLLRTPAASIVAAAAWLVCSNAPATVPAAMLHAWTSPLPGAPTAAGHGRAAGALAQDQLELRDNGSSSAPSALEHAATVLQPDLATRSVQFPRSPHAWLGEAACEMHRLAKRQSHHGHSVAVRAAQHALPDDLPSTALALRLLAQQANQSPSELRSAARLVQQSVAAYVIAFDAHSTHELTSYTAFWAKRPRHN